MKDCLKIISADMGNNLYEMYQDIPTNEVGSTNVFFNLSSTDFYEKIDLLKKEEDNINQEINTCKIDIYFVNNKPIGEVGIRTTLNDFWCNKGSQIFYKIRKSERKKGYGTRMLELALIECRKLGFQKVRINCDDNNVASKKVIEKNGGVIDISSYKTSSGYSSSFIINL